MSEPVLTLGPVLFNWKPEIWRDFYLRVADEAPVARVFLGEIVCAKRTSFWEPMLAEVIERLTAAGKQVALSTPILVTTRRERELTRALCEITGHEIEVNDLGAVALMAGRPHRVGPFVNTYNEATLAWLAGRGAVSVSLPAELPLASLKALAKTAAELGIELEAQVFGRMPLAISARCYHARVHGLHKDNCDYVCGDDPDGLGVDTLDDQPFLAVNGLQTLSRAYLCLAGELTTLIGLGIGALRLSPHSLDMVKVARGFSAVLAGTREPGWLVAELEGMLDGAPLANGFFHARPGAEHVGFGADTTSC